MKNQLISITLCFTLSIACFSQSDLNKQAESFVIAGMFNGFNADTSSRFINFYFDNFFENTVTEVCQINDDGSFVHKSKRPFAKDYFFIYEDMQISFFIAGGDSIFIDIDLEKKKTATLTSDYITFSGSNEAFNNQLDNFYEFFNSELSNFKFDDSMRTHLSPLDYKAYINKRDSIFKLGVSTYIRENNTSKSFEKWVNYSLKYDGISRLLGYRFWYPYKNKLDKDSFLLEIPKPYFSFLNSQTLNNREALENSSYHLFLMEYSVYLHEIRKKDSSKLASEMWKNKNYTAYHTMHQRRIIRNTSGLSQDLLLARFYHQLLTDGRLTVYDTLNKKHPINDRLLNNRLKEINVQVNSILNLEKNYTNIELNNGVNILDSILRKHKGKLIYIDFWATWCASCINEMQFSDNLSSYIKTNELSLVYLGVLCSKESLKIAIVKNKLVGDHYLLTNEQYRSLQAQFGIKGIPRYILIGKDGEIIDANAPKPSETKRLTQLINASLLTN